MTADPYGRWAQLLAEPVTALVPPPEVTSRDRVEGPVPKAAQALARLAVAHGWAVRVTYARGPRVHSTHGTVTRIADSIAVRMRRGEQRAVAFWTDGKFDGDSDPAVAWAIGQAPERLGAEPIKDHVRTKETGQ